MGMELGGSIDIRDKRTLDPVPAHFHGLALVTASNATQAEHDLRSIASRLPVLARCHFDEVAEHVRCEDGVWRDGLTVWCNYVAGKLADPHGTVNMGRLLRTASLGRSGRLSVWAPAVRARRTPLAAPEAPSAPTLATTQQTTPAAAVRGPRTCACCPRDISHRRGDALTCSTTCRKRLERASPLPDKPLSDERSVTDAEVRS